MPLVFGGTAVELDLGVRTHFRRKFDRTTKRQKNPWGGMGINFDFVSSSDLVQVGINFLFVHSLD